jgi:hypothetical protein
MCDGTCGRFHRWSAVLTAVTHAHVPDGSVSNEGHTLTWSVDGSRFELQVGGDAARLCLPDGQLIDLTNREWAGLANAIGMVVKTPKQVTKPAAKKQSTQEKGINTGVRWTEGDDADLLQRWSDGAKLSELMARFDRNEGGITSRLVKLKAAPTREDIRIEDERRRKG